MPFLRFLRENARWLAAGWLLAFCSSWGQTYFISIFAGRIREGFDLSHSAWGVTYLAGTLSSAAVMVWAGSLADRHRIRILGSLVLALMAGACLSMAFTSAFWALPLAVFALRFSGQGMLTHISAVAMARWFNASRGKALAIASSGYSFGEALLPILFVSLLSFSHWQALWILPAALALAAIPALSALLRVERKPQSMPESKSSAGMLGRHWTRGETLRHWTFWCLAPVVLWPSMFVTSLFFQQVHLSETKGWSLSDFAALIPFFTLSSVAAMLLSGLAIDRFGSIRLLPFYQIPMAAGFALLPLGGGFLPAAIAFCLIGCVSGAQATLTSACWAECYGTRHLGAIKSVMSAVMVLGSAIGPGVSGYLIDAGASLSLQMLGASAITLAFCLVTGLAVMRSRPLFAAP